MKDTNFPFVRGHLLLISMILTSIFLIPFDDAFSIDKCAPSTQLNNDKKTVLDTTTIHQNNRNSIVFITAYSDFSNQQGSTGSGVVLDICGHIVTNYHVIKHASFDSIVVTLANDKSYEADVISYDPKLDLAVLKIPVSTSDFVKFPATGPAFLGCDKPLLRRGDTFQGLNSSEFRKLDLPSGIVKSGEKVIAIGNPSVAKDVVTEGIVSKTCEMMPNDVGSRTPVIIFDANIYHGNSGGALFNQYGELIGITGGEIAGITESQQPERTGLFYATPYTVIIGEIVAGLGHYYDKSICSIVYGTLTTTSGAKPEVDQLCYLTNGDNLAEVKISQQALKKNPTAKESLPSENKDDPICSAIRFLIPC